MPPELEKVDADQLKKEQEAKTNSQKQQRQMYEQMRNNIANDEDAEECTVEEVKEEPVEAEKKPIDDIEAKLNDPVAAVMDMMKKANVEEEPEFVSNLEELD